MNLPKAKEIIDHNIKVAGNKMPPDVKDALQLGSEALNWINGARKEGCYRCPPQLPSETPKANPLPTLADIINRNNHNGGTK